MNADQLLARCPGLTYRQLHHWCANGYLRPTNNGAGSGRVRRFNADEVRVVEMMSRLVAVGMLPRAASRVAWAALAGTPDEPVGVEIAPGVVIVVGAPDRERVPA
jgi:hypothetical protein